MKIYILLIAFIILFAIPLTYASPIQNEVNGKYIQYWESGNNLYNFSVRIDGQQVTVFDSLNYTNPMPLMNHPGKLRVIDNYLTPIIYYGLGTLNISLNENIDYSIENISNTTYVKLSSDNYYGILFSNANLVHNGNALVFSLDYPFYLLFMTLPISYYMTESSYENISGSIYSTYSISDSGVSDYSLNGLNSSVEIIKNIGSYISSDSDIEDSLIFVNSISPMIVGTGFVYGYNISLLSPFNYELINQTKIFNMTLPFNLSFIPSNIIPQHSIYAILYNGEMIGTANVFGYSYLSGNSLLIPDVGSTFIIQFKPLNYAGFQGNYVPSSGNISLQIYANESAYFIPLSPSVLVTSINISNDVITSNIYQYQNSTIEFFIPSGYRINNLSVNGNDLLYGNQTNGFTVTRIGNQSVALINLNQSGEVTLLITLSKLSGEHRVPLFTMFLLSAIILIIAALGLIYYARRKSIEIYEKNN